jgi:hypothetical protein
VRHEQGAEVVCHVDKKAFRGADRDRLLAFLAAEPHTGGLACRAVLNPAELC